MGNHEIKLIDWLLLNSQQAGINLQRHNWTDKYIVGLQHITAELRLPSGRYIAGSGKDWTEEGAIQKAVAELAERMAWSSSDEETTNGFAAHIDENSAQISSFRELLERDLFLGHWFAGCPLFNVDWREQLGQTKSGEKILKALNHKDLNGFRFLCGTTLKCSGFRCIAAAAYHPKHGIHISLALENEISIALEKCFLEIIHNCVYKLSNVIEPISLSHFLELKTVTVEDHRRLCCDPGYANVAINRMFLPDIQVESSNDEVPLPEVKTSRINLEFPFSNSPLVVCRSYSADMQKLFFGSDWKKILFARVSLFNRSLHSNGISSPIPHPLV